MRDQLPSDAVNGINAIIDFDPSHLYGCTVDVTHYHSDCRKDCGQKQVILKVEFLDVELSGEIDDKWRDFDSPYVYAILLRRKHYLLPLLRTLINEVRRFFEVYHLPKLIRDQGG